MVTVPLIPSAAPVPTRRRAVWNFMFGFLAGVAALFALALFASLRNL